jgi:hypothetical protein
MMNRAERRLVEGDRFGKLPEAGCAGSALGRRRFFALGVGGGNNQFGLFQPEQQLPLRSIGAVAPDLRAGVGLSRSPWRADPPLVLPGIER